jgi:DNA-binding MarR family transcriptional regulator
MKETFLTHLIGRIRKAARREFEGRVADLDITTAQFMVLRRLWEGDGILTTILTKDVCSDGGTITGLLDRLEAKGLIRRERSTKDRRAVHVYLTPVGCDLETPLMNVVREINRHALAGFSEEERAALHRALERIGENLGTE